MIIQHLKNVEFRQNILFIVCIMQTLPTILWQFPETDKKWVSSFDSILERFL